MGDTSEHPGGILNDAGTVTVNRSLISSNTAAYGGGIMK